jgi:TP901 family phage tail tape measure protein
VAEDKKYELLIVIRTQSELSGALTKITADLKAVESAGAGSLGAVNKKLKETAVAAEAAGQKLFDFAQAPGQKIFDFSAAASALPTILGRVSTAAQSAAAATGQQANEAAELQTILGRLAGASTIAGKAAAEASDEGTRGLIAEVAAGKELRQVKEAQAAAAAKDLAEERNAISQRLQAAIQFDERQKTISAQAVASASKATDEQIAGVRRLLAVKRDQEKAAEKDLAAAEKRAAADRPATLQRLQGLLAIDVAQRKSAKVAEVSADDTAKAAQRIAREFGGTVVTAVGQATRSFGIGTVAAQSLGRSVVRGAADASTGVGALAGSAGIATAAMGGIAIAALAVGGALHELGQRGLEVSKAFESVAIRSASSAFQGLQKSVFDLSNRTGIAFDSLAASLGRALLKTGGQAAEANKLMKVAADTALAAITTPEAAVEHLGDLMRSYGISVSRVKDLSNDLLITQRIAREEFDQLARGLSELAPQANALGIPFEEIAAAVAGLANAGLPAQRAIFGLRSDFADLLKSTSQLRLKLKELNVDISPEAFRADGIVGVFAKMEAALSRSGSDLSAFLGEARKSGPVLSILGRGGVEATRALNEMRSGTDQARESIERLQNLPGRQLANFLNEVNNLLNELGTSLVTFVQPLVKDIAALLHELNALAEESPDLASALKALATLPFGALLGQLMVLDTQIKGATVLVHALRGETGDLNDKAKEAANTFKSLGTAIQDAIPKGPIDVPVKFQATGTLKSALLDFQEQLEDRNARNFISEIDKLRDHAGTAAGFFEELTDAIRRNGRGLDIARVASEEFDTASEKQARSMEATISRTEILIGALGRLGVNVGVLSEKYERWIELQNAAQSDSRLAERVALESVRAVRGLGESYGLFAENADAARAATRGVVEEMIRQRDLSTRTVTGVGFLPTPEQMAGLLTSYRSRLSELSGLLTSAFTLTPEQLLNTPISQLEQFANRARGTTDDVVRGYQQIISSIEAGIAESNRLKREGKEALISDEDIEKAQKFVEILQRGLIDPRQRGFLGGLSEGIDDFVAHAQDGFQLGTDAVTQFANGSVDAISQFLMTLGTGKAGMKDFTVAMLQLIEQIIAKLLAMQIVASALGFFGGLLGGGGGDVTGGGALNDLALGGATGGIVSGQMLSTSGLGSGAARWAGSLPGMTARSFAFGGVATSPTAAIFAEKPGMAEAFVPLPGPNRGIPVEFKGGAGGRGSVDINLTIVSQSIDPRTAGEVMLAQVPLLARGLAAVLDGGGETDFKNAIRASR